MGRDMNDVTCESGAAPVKSAIDEAAMRQWLDPLLFGNDTATPDLPATLLPGWLGDYCGAVAAATQTPPALAIMLGLAVIATAAQKRYEVSPYDDTGYTEPLALWTTAVMEPGARKSAVKELLTGPLIEYEKELVERTAGDVREARAKRDCCLKLAEKLKGDASRADDSERPGIISRLAEVDRDTPAPAHPPKLWTDDCTPERLQGLLAENGERIGVISDEGGLFEIMAGLYTGGKVNLNVFLQAHAGSPVRVDRQSRSETLFRPALSLGLAIQPDVLREMGFGSKRGFRGKGLLARILFVVPESNIGKRDVTRRAVIPETVKAAYAEGLTRLLAIPPRLDEQGREIPRYLRLDSEARAAWLTFADWVEKSMGDGTLMAARDWAGKLPGAALRIAGLLHLVRSTGATTDGTIDVDTIGPALDLAEKLIPHVLKAFDLVGQSANDEDALVCYYWITGKNEDSFKRSELHTALSGRFRKLERLEAALKELERRHIITEPIKTGGKSGRPSIVYRVNPAVLTGVTP